MNICLGVCVYVCSRVCVFMGVYGYSFVTLKLPNHIFIFYYNSNTLECKVQHSMIHTSILLLACKHTKP